MLLAEVYPINKQVNIPTTIRSCIFPKLDLWVVSFGNFQLFLDRRDVIAQGGLVNESKRAGKILESDDNNLLAGGERSMAVFI